MNRSWFSNKPLKINFESIDDDLHRSTFRSKSIWPNNSDDEDDPTLHARKEPSLPVQEPPSGRPDETNTFLHLELKKSVKSENQNRVPAYMRQTTMNISSEHRKVWQVKQLQESVFKRTRSKENLANREVYSFHPVRSNSINPYRGADTLGSKVQSGNLKDFNRHDYVFGSEELEKRLKNSYKVKQDLTVEFLETEKTMKLMSDIMQGGTDSNQDENSVQYDNDGKPKHQDAAKLEKDGEVAITDSDEDFDDDQSEMAKRRQSQRVPSIMRKSLNFDINGVDDGNLQKFYGEVLDEGDYDHALIKKLFGRKPIFFSRKMMERRKFQDELDFGTIGPEPNTTDRQSTIHNQSGTGHDDLSFETFTSSDDYNDPTPPFHQVEYQRDRRAGVILNQNRNDSPYGQLPT